MSMAGAEPIDYTPGLIREPGDWRAQLLQELGVTNPTPQDYAFLEAWFTEEHGSSGYTGNDGTGSRGGLLNPLDTELRVGPADTLFNVTGYDAAGHPLGVQNFASPDEGVQANAQTLLTSDPAYGYGGIVEGLRSGQSLTQLEEAENASAWGSAFPNVGKAPRPVGGSVSAQLSASTNASGVPGLGGLADSFAQGFLGGIRDALQMAGGLALIALGVVMILRDLQSSGVPLGPLGRVAKMALPGERARRGTQRAELQSRQERALTAAQEAATAREHTGRRAEAETARREQKAAQERAAAREARARARQEEAAAAAVKGTAAGGTTKAAKAHERARQRAQDVAHRRETVHEAPYNARGGRARAGQGATDEAPF